MSKQWIDCIPLDRSTAGTMRFILSTCQDIKRWSHERVLRGDRKGSTESRQETAEKWVKEYLKQNPLLNPPRYALQDAVMESLRRGPSYSPELGRDWNCFSVEGREGWKGEKKNYKKHITWDEYIMKIGLTEKKKDPRAVSAYYANTSLFENGMVSFNWGKVGFRGRTFSRKLADIATEAGVDGEKFLSKVAVVEFCLQEKRAKFMDIWKLNFVLEREIEADALQSSV